MGPHKWISLGPRIN